MTYLLLCALAILPALTLANDAEPFYKTIETPPAPELTPSQAQGTFVIAPGFELTLVASEPLVEGEEASACGQPTRHGDAIGSGSLGAVVQNAGSAHGLV